jgi:hypothetical protein
VVDPHFSPTIYCVGRYAPGCGVTLGLSFTPCGGATEDKSALRAEVLRMNEPRVASACPESRQRRDRRVESLARKTIFAASSRRSLGNAG